jgi:hypothetical protein
VQDIPDFDLSNAETDRGQRTAFGTALAKLEDRIILGFRVLRVGTKQGAALWRLEPAAPPESPESGAPREPREPKTGPTPPAPINFCVGDDTGEPSILKAGQAEPENSLFAPAGRGAKQVHEVHEVHGPGAPDAIRLVTTHELS